MKNTYVKPEMQVEEFLANQYVAACGIIHGNYVFTCDAPKGTVYYYDKNSTTKQKLGGYKPCGDKHVTTGTDDYFEGFVDYNNNGSEDDGEHVLVWREKWRNYYIDYHASKSLSGGDVETERS